MKITNIIIEEYKNLNALNIDCSKHNGLSVIIGNNGSGKSNFLEALSDIYYSKYTVTKNEAKGYEIYYSDFSGEKFITNDSSKSKLPKRVIAIYSGEEDRMWKKYYQKIYNSYIKDIIGDKAIEYPKMLYLNRFYWEISLLCLLTSNAEDNKEFLVQNIGIDLSRIISIKFIKNEPEFKNSNVKNFVDSLKPQYNTLQEFKEIYTTDPDLFLKLYIAYTDKENKLIKDIIINFNDGRSIEDLSEGQKKQLLMKAAFEFAGQEDTLFILDEPDAHIHVSNKKVILDIIKPYQNNRQIIITTHSPTIVQAINENHIVLLDKGKKDNFAQDKVKAIKHLVGKDSFYNVLFGTKDILLVEGKTDKIHLENAFSKLKENYPEMDFDIISMNSCSFIKQAMIGLSNSEIKWDKKFIAILDDDKEGKEAISKNFKKSNFNDDIKHIQDGNGVPSNEFYAFLIPKPDNYTDSVTIENYYDSSKYEAAFSKAVEEKIGYFNTLSIDKISDDLKNKSKIILAEHSKTFEKSDFDRFKMIFDKIKLIQEN